MIYVQLNMVLVNKDLQTRSYFIAPPEADPAERIEV